MRWILTQEADRARGESKGGGETARQVGRQVDRQVDRQEDRQVDRQVDIKAYILWARHEEESPKAPYALRSSDDPLLVAAVITPEALHLFVFVF